MTTHIAAIAADIAGIAVSTKDTRNVTGIAANTAAMTPIIANRTANSTITTDLFASSRIYGETDDIISNAIHTVANTAGTLNNTRITADIAAKIFIARVTAKSDPKFLISADIASVVVSLPKPPRSSPDPRTASVTPWAA
jgi:hypothetical protein